MQAIIKRNLLPISNKVLSRIKKFQREKKKWLIPVRLTFLKTYRSNNISSIYIEHK
jgi:hypothetical protein